MEASGGNSDAYRGSSGSAGNSRRYGINLTTSSFFRSPVSTFLEYTGILRVRSSHQESENLINGGVSVGLRDSIQPPRPDDPVAAGSREEVSIRIIGTGEQEEENEPFVLPMSRTGSAASVSSSAIDGRSDRGGTGVEVPNSINASVGTEGAEGVGASNRDSSYQRYDIQHAARWIEQVLPFSLLLLIVFIRQHLQGFCATLWVATIVFKSNDILRKQTALKGERKISVLVGICIAFALHIFVVYWWYWNDDLVHPLIMLPPKQIPSFWNSIFIIMVNDALVRQAGMLFKCILLMCYKNSRGRNYRKQGQMLTFVEYLLVLYRGLVPTPVWYRFFLNKEYGSLFSSLMTGLYLTFKLTSMVEKVQHFFAAVRALSRKEIHYGAYATAEQVNAVGDLCAICQEKMHAPILLRCKHIFCEDCVSEWFERERTCPLCRALVKPADLKSFSDGSTCLVFQLF